MKKEELSTLRVRPLGVKIDLKEPKITGNNAD